MLARKGPVPYDEYFTARSALYDTCLLMFDHESQEEEKPVPTKAEPKPPPVYSRFSPTAMAKTDSSVASKHSQAKPQHKSKTDQSSSKSKSKPKPNTPAPKPKPGYQSTSPAMTDSQGLPMNIPTQKPDDISTASTLSSSHSHKSRPRRNRSVKSNQDQQSEKSEFIPGYHDYADLDPKDYGEPIQKFTFKVKDSDSVIRDRSLRAKPYTCRPKFDSA